MSEGERWTDSLALGKASKTFVSGLEMCFDCIYWSIYNTQCLSLRVVHGLVNLSAKIKMFSPADLPSKYDQIKAQKMASQILYNSRVGLDILLFK